MAAIRARDTKPEMVVRSALHQAGLRFRLHRRDLPGTPDMVLPRYGVVVMVHGCFWHHHGCANSQWPRTRAEFWRKKILANVARDRRVSEALRTAGWREIVVWECQVTPARLTRLVRQIVRGNQASRLSVR
jgi:DNA mismatch endonuclease (patch repair protein)